MRSYIKNVVDIGGSRHAILNVSFNVAVDTKTVEKRKGEQVKTGYFLKGNVDVYFSFEKITIERELLERSLELAIERSIQDNPQLYTQSNEILAKLCDVNNQLKCIFESKGVKKEIEVGALHFNEKELTKIDYKTRVKADGTEKTSRKLDKDFNK